ncbi:hypothetical protein BDF21DRAFT_393506 [Thamnidium elegans]|nr:hypothetical protein BDF21DRAFT_393506 [Thamnidium elegans]
MRFTVISLGIIAAVMISSAHAIGGVDGEAASDVVDKGKDIVGKGKDIVDKGKDIVDKGKEGAGEVAEEAAEEAADEAGNTIDRLRYITGKLGDTVSEAKNGASQVKAAASGPYVARRSFLVRRNLGRAVYKRHSRSDRDSQVSKRFKEYEKDEDEDEDDEDENEDDEDKNNKNKSFKVNQGTINHRDSI